MKETLLTDRQASDIFPRSVAWFRRKRWEGGGPAFVRIGRSIFYRRDELDSYFSRQATEHRSTSEYEGVKAGDSGRKPPPALASNRAGAGAGR